MTFFLQEGGGPDQIPNFVVCEIGTWGTGSSQTLICPIFKSDLRTKDDLRRPVPLQASRWCYPSIVTAQRTPQQPQQQNKHNCIWVETNQSLRTTTHQHHILKTTWMSRNSAIRALAEKWKKYVHFNFSENPLRKSMKLGGRVLKRPLFGPQCIDFVNLF